MYSSSLGGTQNKAKCKFCKSSIKQELAKVTVRVLYNPWADTKVTAGASFFGLGAALLQSDNQRWRLAVYASRSHYWTQINGTPKLGLAIAWFAKNSPLDDHSKWRQITAIDTSSQHATPWQPTSMCTQVSFYTGKVRIHCSSWESVCCRRSLSPQQKKEVKRSSRRKTRLVSLYLPYQFVKNCHEFAKEVNCLTTNAATRLPMGSSSHWSFWVEQECYILMVDSFSHYRGVCKLVSTKTLLTPSRLYLSQFYGANLVYKTK